LASEVWVIVDAVFKSEALVQQMFSFLEKDAPLNNLLASFVSRVVAVLLEKKPQQMVDLLKSRGTIIDVFLKHLSNASVMELLLKVVAAEDLTDNGGILQWLREAHLIKSLVSKFEPKNDAETHENAAQALVDIVRASAAKPSPLMEELESEDVVQSLLSSVMTEGAHSTLLHGLTVIIELIRRNSRPAFDTETKVEALPPVLRVAVQNLGKFKAILHRTPPMERTFTTMGEIQPVGFPRLKVLEFVAALVQAGFECVDSALVQEDVFSSCFELFFAFPWNNFLHALVERMVKAVFTGTNDNLKEALITKAKLVDRILEAEQNNAIEASKPRGVRRGFMGHLTLIASTIQDEAPCSEQVARALEAIPAWKTYVESTLREARSAEGRPLGGNKMSGSAGSGSPPTSDEDDYDDPELAFDNDDDLVLKGDDTQNMDEDQGFDAEREFKQIDQNSHDSDDEDQAPASADAKAATSEGEKPPSLDAMSD
jgi:serine/threonine-protein phosphatase 6 regulatory subunit 3